MGHASTFHGVRPFCLGAPASAPSSTRCRFLRSRFGNITIRTRIKLDDLLRELNGVEYEGRKLRFELAKEQTVTKAVGMTSPSLFPDPNPSTEPSLNPSIEPSPTPALSPAPTPALSTAPTPALSTARGPRLCSRWPSSICSGQKRIHSRGVFIQSSPQHEQGHCEELRERIL